MIESRPKAIELVASKVKAFLDQAIKEGESGNRIRKEKKVVSQIFTEAIKQASKPGDPLEAAKKRLEAKRAEVDAALKGIAEGKLPEKKAKPKTELPPVKD